MLFNSLGFIFVFLPSVVMGYYFIGSSISRFWAIIFLVFASLIFYAWWNPVYIILLIVSMAFNYYVGFKVFQKTDKRAKIWLVFGIIVNLGAIGYFKYFNFFIDNINIVLGSSFNFEKIILPLAISFFTFQQISFLVDRYKRKISSCHFVDYALFVTFFPQLIAGPIVHHKEMMPQFLANNKFKLNWE